MMNTEMLDALLKYGWTYVLCSHSMARQLSELDGFTVSGFGDAWILSVDDEGRAACRAARRLVLTDVPYCTEDLCTTCEGIGSITDEWKNEIACPDCWGTGLRANQIDRP